MNRGSSKELSIPAPLTLWTWKWTHQAPLGIVTYRYPNPLCVTSPQTAILTSPAAPAPCFRWTTIVSLLTVMGCCSYLMYSYRPKRTALALTASVASLVSGLKVRRKCKAALNNVSSIAVFITSPWSRGYRHLVCNKLLLYPNGTECWIVDVTRTQKKQLSDLMHY